MNDYTLLIFSMIACLLVGIFRKHCGNRFSNKKAMYNGFNAVVSAVCAIALAVSGGGISGVSAYTLLLGLAFGIVTALQVIFTLKAYENGPFSYTAVIVSLSTIIPTLSGYIFWNEEILPIQLVGIVLMLASFVCSVDFEGEKRKSGILWMICAAVSFVCTGLIGVMQKSIKALHTEMNLTPSSLLPLLYLFFILRYPSLLCKLLRKNQVKPMRTILHLR